MSLNSQSLHLNPVHTSKIKAKIFTVLPLFGLGLVGGSPALALPKSENEQPIMSQHWCPYFQSPKIRPLYSDPVSPWAADHLQRWRASCLSSHTAILSSCVWKIGINRNQQCRVLSSFPVFCRLFAKLISERALGLRTHSMK